MTAIRTQTTLIDFPAKIRELVDHADAYHSRYNDSETFAGPSLYFHLQALAAAKGSDFPRCLEYVYAMLASWGMHRMGKGGSKMRPFQVFEESVLPLQQKVQQVRKLNPSEMTEAGWILLEEIFKSIKVMTSGTSLVGNSKVMAHLMPNIVPPIDREYTLKFLTGSGRIRNDIDGEWRLMRLVIEQLFIPVSVEASFIQKADAWMADRKRFCWDTSIFKIIDNLIIGAMQQRKARGVEVGP